jgi:hypothetical protein
LAQVVQVGQTATLQVAITVAILLLVQLRRQAGALDHPPIQAIVMEVPVATAVLVAVEHNETTPLVVQAFQVKDLLVVEEVQMGVQTQAAVAVALLEAHKVVMAAWRFCLQYLEQQLTMLVAAVEPVVAAHNLVWAAAHRIHHKKAVAQTETRTAQEQLTLLQTLAVEVVVKIIPQMGKAVLVL